MPFIDHVVHLVEGLGAACRDFERWGFTVTSGGTHAGGLTENALIPFVDGSYIELLAFTWASALHDLAELERLALIAWVLPGRTALDRRFLPRGGASGLVDLAIGCTDLRNLISRCRGEGLAMDGPFDGSRIRTDGRRVAWQLAFAADPHLPFLIEDVTDRRLRVPDGSTARHPNGVTGIASVSYVIPRTAMTAFETLMRALDCRPTHDRGDTRVWAVGDATISVTTADRATSIRPISLALTAPRLPSPTTRAPGLGAITIVAGGPGAQRNG